MNIKDLKAASAEYERAKREEEKNAEAERRAEEQRKAADEARKRKEAQRKAAAAVQRRTKEKRKNAAWNQRRAEDNRRETMEPSFSLPRNYSYTENYTSSSQLSWPTPTSEDERQLKQQESAENVGGCLALISIPILAYLVFTGEIESFSAVILFGVFFAVGMMWRQVLVIVIVLAIMFYVLHSLGI